MAKNDSWAGMTLGTAVDDIRVCADGGQSRGALTRLSWWQEGVASRLHICT